jgi:hypothetical protein
VIFFGRSKYSPIVRQPHGVSAVVAGPCMLPQLSRQTLLSEHEIGGRPMAKARKKRKYSPSVGVDVEREMRSYNRGTARSGPGGKGGKVKSRKQAIAIALSEARKEGKRVPKKRA